MPSALKGTSSVLTHVILSLLLASCVLGISLLSSGSSVFPNQAACAMQTSFFFTISLVICLAAMLWGLMNGDPTSSSTWCCVTHSCCSEEWLSK